MAKVRGWFGYWLDFSWFLAGFSVSSNKCIYAKYNQEIRFNYANVCSVNNVNCITIHLGGEKGISDS
ncbi:hypothetical protein THF5G08_30317 [Vibrio jasicida]|nr:hypothetical protein THF5G08_30317 [Vibrio jasicida]